LDHANVDFRVTPIRRLSLHGRSIVLALVLWPAGSAARGQQPYIPWLSETRPAERQQDADGGIASSTHDRLAPTLWSATAVDFALIYQEAQRTVPLAPKLDRTGTSVSASTSFPATPDPGQPESTSPALNPSNDVAATTPGATTETSDSSPKTYESFGVRLFQAYFGPKEEEEEAEASHRERAIVPFDSPPFPFSDHTSPVIGYRDTTVWPLMEAIYKGPNGDWWKKKRIKIYGWANPSYNASTSRFSNIPQSYNIVPNSLQLSQFILICERVTDSVQTDHCDWGFKFTQLVGIDYRYTTAKGWFSD
jgi:hypothetical protein